MVRGLLAFLPAALWAGAWAQVARSPLAIAENRIAAANSLTATMTITFPKGTPQRWAVQFLKPNLYSIVGPDEEYRSDGKVETIYLPSTKQYMYTGRTGSQIVDAPLATGLEALFPGNPPLKQVGPVLAGAQGSAATVSMPGGVITLYLDANTGLPSGYDRRLGSGTLSVRYSGIRLRVPLDAKTFAWSPPAGAKLLLPQTFGSALLMLGAKAPTPPASLANGKTLDLAHEFATHKATLLYFSSGVESFSELEPLSQLLADLQGQNFQIIAISSNDPSEKVDFPVVEDKDGQIAKAYGIQFPSSYLVGADGKIGARFLGYDPAGLVKELRKRGFRI